MFKKSISYKEALKLLGKKVITIKKRDQMDFGEVGKVVAIFNKKRYFPYDYAIIVQFNNCSKKNIPHYIPYDISQLSLYKDFNYTKERIKPLFYIFYPDDLQELSNN